MPQYGLVTRATDIRNVAIMAIIIIPAEIVKANLPLRVAFGYF